MVLPSSVPSAWPHLSWAATVHKKGCPAALLPCCSAALLLCCSAALLLCCTCTSSKRSRRSNKSLQRSLGQAWRQLQIAAPRLEVLLMPCQPFLCGAHPGVVLRTQSMRHGRAKTPHGGLFGGENFGNLTRLLQTLSQEAGANTTSSCSDRRRKPVLHLWIFSRPKSHVDWTALHLFVLGS